MMIIIIIIMQRLTRHVSVTRMTNRRRISYEYSHGEYHIQVNPLIKMSNFIFLVVGYLWGVAEKRARLHFILI